MNKTLALLCGVAATALAGAFTATAGPGPDQDELVIDGQTYVTETKSPEGHPIDTIYSGWRFRSDETQALQKDDFENPAFTYVEQGIALWNTAGGTSGKSCADCHGDPESMRGLRANTPKWVESVGRPQAMEHLINASIKEHQGAEPWKWESDEMLSMTSLLSSVSRGLPIEVQIDGPMAPWFEKGKELYYTRVGQLDLACANCHEDNYGNMIRADHLSQGMINGFPVYRFKWSGVGSIHRRFKGCMDQVRATPHERGSDEFTALELYIAWRGTGLSVEGPSVRN
jgi:sulfur-oxidizing protein SoxA